MNITEFKALIKRKNALMRKELAEFEYKEHGNKPTVKGLKKMCEVLNG